MSEVLEHSIGQSGIYFLYWTKCYPVRINFCSTTQRRAYLRSAAAAIEHTLIDSATLLCPGCITVHVGVALEMVGSSAVL